MDDKFIAGRNTVDERTGGGGEKHVKTSMASMASENFVAKPDSDGFLNCEWQRDTTGSAFRSSLNPPWSCKQKQLG